MKKCILKQSWDFQNYLNQLGLKKPIYLQNYFPIFTDIYHTVSVERSSFIPAISSAKIYDASKFKPFIFKDLCTQFPVIQVRRFFIKYSKHFVEYARLQNPPNSLQIKYINFIKGHSSFLIFRSFFILLLHCLTNKYFSNLSKANYFVLP